MTQIDGMDVAVVQNVGSQLKAHAGALEGVVRSIDSIVGQLQGVWRGSDASTFHGWWQHTHRPALLSAASSVDGLGQAALNNASDQSHVSSVSTASGHSGVGPVVVAAGAAGAVAATGSAAAAGASAAAGPSESSTLATTWAGRQVGSNLDDGGCLTFVRQAYQAGNVDINKQVNFTPNGNTYPDQFWGGIDGGHKVAAGQAGAGSPPAGALVFFSGTDKYPSHVELSLGNGQLVSTTDAGGHGVHQETLADRPMSRYLGWWMPSS
jgi:uncharacterized protein YukE